MKKVFLVFCILASGATVWGADKDLLTPEPARITDEAIAADIKVIKSLQDRLAALNNKGVLIASYHFAKAQAWLDFALDEYTINDRSRVVEEALRQGHKLIGQLEAGEKEIGMSTPIIPTSTIVRPDLWYKAETLKKRISSLCAGDKIAQLEVQLVWAGHEEMEMGWRHAKPYLQAAERLAREADEQMAACPPEPAAAVAAKNNPVPAPVGSAAQTLALTVTKAESAAAQKIDTAAAPLEPAAAVAAKNNLVPAPVGSAETTVALTAATAESAVAPKVGTAAAAVKPPTAEGKLAATAPEQTPSGKASEPTAKVPPTPVSPLSAAEPLRVQTNCPETTTGAVSRSIGPLPDSVHFALDSASISTVSAAVIDRIAAAMHAEQTLRVVLYGHADQRGNSSYNMSLSRRRADNVRASLAKAGIPADRISIAPFGKLRPLTREKNIEAYARNRRVEFFFTLGPPQPMIPQQDDLQPEKVD